MVNLSFLSANILECLNTKNSNIRTIITLSNNIESSGYFSYMNTRITSFIG